MTPEDLCQNDPAYWAIFKKIKLQKEIFSFKDRPYQIEPMQSIHRRLCYMKATQGGFTEIEVLKSLWGMIYKKYSAGVLYMFPTTDDVGEFSKSRFNPLIQANQEWIGKFVKTGGKGTDTTSLKKIHDAFLYLRGARLTQNIGTGINEKESTKLRGIPTDKVVFDEWDLMDPASRQKAIMRMADSLLKDEVYISNPTLPDFGIDAIFSESDQRHLFRKCDCGEWICAELGFPECVGIRENGTGFIKCSKCGLEVTMRNIEWVPQKRENSDYMHGYRWSQLSSVKNDPAEILEQFTNPPENNLGDVIRLRLGLPYVAAEDKLSKDVVFGRCGSEMSPTFSKEQTAMGVDVGKIKHIVIGVRTGEETYQILKAIRLSEWSDIHDIARKFNVKSAVIDARPYEDEARRFQAEEPYKTYLCEYNESTVSPVVYDDVKKLVKVNRTEICDATHRLFSKELIKLPRRDKAMEEFASQVCNIAKVLEENKRSGTTIYRYRKVGGDEHYRHAFNYFYLAARGGRIRRANRRSQRFTQAVNDFK